MATPRYVTDKEYRSFRESVPPMVANAMDLGLLTGHSLSAILQLRWKDVEAIGKPREKWALIIGRIRSGNPRRLAITPTIEGVLKTCKLMLPHWPREFVFRLEDGGGVSVGEFNKIWNLYMRRWGGAGAASSRFSFRDIRVKALADQQSARRVTRRRTPRSGSTA
jgi:integrase